jgi:succinate dehydrogenase hydrophobic anchor subunit
MVYENSKKLEKDRTTMDNKTSNISDQGLDKKLFFVVGGLLLLICILLMINLFLQWNNYNQGIKLAVEGGQNQHAMVLTYSRAMDFAFVKTSTIFLGFVLVFVGALYLLRINEVAYKFGVKNGPTDVSFQTASPGLVLVTLGVITVLVTTYNKSYVSVSPSFNKTELNQEVNEIDINIDEAVSKLSFVTDSSELTSDSVSNIDVICNYMRNNNVKDISVEAHGDGLHEPEYEIALGERRSKMINTLLRKQCSYQVNYSVVSYGEESNNVGGKKITISFR